MRDVGDVYIWLIFKHTSNNRKEAAQMLGIGLRTLVGRIADFAASDAKAGSADGEAAAGKAAATGQG
jgi:DNA-binding NtrC family response regulator